MLCYSQIDVVSLELMCFSLSLPLVRRTRVRERFQHETGSLVRVVFLFMCHENILSFPYKSKILFTIKFIHFLVFNRTFYFEIAIDAQQVIKIVERYPVPITHFPPITKININFCTHTHTHKAVQALVNG